MSLNDLLQLDEVDLVNLTNRGTVRRAMREVEEGEYALEINVGDSMTLFEWSDPATCTFQNEGTLQEARCTCRAVGLCRHIIRSVLAFQHRQDSASPAAPQEPWNPGDISDSDLQNFGWPLLSSAQDMMDDGVVAELIVSRRPSATFVDRSVSVRFSVPFSLAYAQCDCGVQGPCAHVPLAVLLFRRMAKDRSFELITTQDERPLNTEEAEFLKAAEDSILSLTSAGLNQVDKTGMDRLVALEERLRNADFEWHAQIVSELHQELSHYTDHDARFRVEGLALALGEFGIRRDALMAEKIPIPRLHVRGKRRTGLPELGQRRLLGLGCVVERERKGTRLRAFLADHISGQIQVAEHLFPIQEGEAPPQFSELANQLVWAGRPFSLLGRGQVVSKNRNAIHGHRLRVDHHNLSVYTQNLNWEELPPKILPETFNELRERLTSLPPASLRSRGVEDCFAVQIESREEVTFKEDQHVMSCILRDAEGESLRLVHPYYSQGGQGFETAFSALSNSDLTLCFVAGRARQTPSGLQIHPSALVFENADKSRWMIQPWVEAEGDVTVSSSTRDSEHAHENLLNLVLERLGERALLDANQRPELANLARRAQSCGLQTLAHALSVLETPQDLQNACMIATLLTHLE